MDEKLEALLAEHGAELVQPFPGPRLRFVVERLCGQLDRLPLPGRFVAGRWGWWRHGALGCRLQLWRLWSDVPVIRMR